MKKWFLVYYIFEFDNLCTKQYNDYDYARLDVKRLAENWGMKVIGFYEVSYSNKRPPEFAEVTELPIPNTEHHEDCDCFECNPHSYL